MLRGSVIMKMEKGSTVLSGGTDFNFLKLGCLWLRVSRASRNINVANEVVYYWARDELH